MRERRGWMLWTARHYGWPLLQACLAQQVTVEGMRVRIPGPLKIRVSVVAGNVRLHRMMKALLRPGGRVVDVGANIGYNTVYAAKQVGSTGRVIAIEPAADNLAVLRHNIATNCLTNVVVRPVAAGRDLGIREFFLRGELSAVNSFFRESCYGAVTGVAHVPVVPLDELFDEHPDVVKIDVEGAELDVLAGMPRLLRSSALRLLVEWHPVLQEAAGHAPDALPRMLLEQGFTLHAVWHTGVTRLDRTDLPALIHYLHDARRPVDVLAHR